jgi:hypothetical protein
MSATLSRVNLCKALTHAANVEQKLNSPANAAASSLS